MSIRKPSIWTRLFIILFKRNDVRFLRMKYDHMALSMKFLIDIADISDSDRFPKCGSPCTSDSDCPLAQNGGKCRSIKDLCHMTCQGNNLNCLLCCSITQIIYYMITIVTMLVFNTIPVIILTCRS